MNTATKEQNLIHVPENVQRNVPVPPFDDASDVWLACRWMAICAVLLGGWGLGQWLYRVLG